MDTFRLLQLDTFGLIIYTQRATQLTTGIGTPVAEWLVGELAGIEVTVRFDSLKSLPKELL